MNDVISNAYESIKGYVPDDANAVIESERKRITHEIDKTFEELRTEFAATIASTIAELEKEINDEADGFGKEISALFTEYEKEIEKSDDDFKKKVTALKEKLDQYENASKKLGEATRKGISLAAKGAGIPII